MQRRRFEGVAALVVRVPLGHQELEKAGLREANGIDANREVIRPQFELLKPLMKITRIVNDEDVIAEANVALYMVAAANCVGKRSRARNVAERPHPLCHYYEEDPFRYPLTRGSRYGRPQPWPGLAVEERTAW